MVADTAKVTVND